LAIFLNEGRLAEEARNCSAEVMVIPENRYSFFRILNRAADFLRGRDVRVLHSHRYKENLLAALLASRLGIPAVVRTQHGAPEPVPPQNRLWHSLVHWVDRVVARQSTDRIIAVSEDLRRRLAAQYGEERVALIHNGIDLERVVSSLSVAEAKQQLGLPADSLVVGTAGRLERIKRLDIFLEAAKRILAEEPRARFVIAGDGRQAPELRELAAQLNLFERVLFLGHRHDVHDVIRAMDVFVLCSDHEGLPMVLLEAMALGTPVVVRPVGGIAEVVEDERNGVWVRSDRPYDLANACLRVLQDADLRRCLCAAGMTQVRERFSGARTAAQVSKLYRTLCRNP
jgi:glycosyltransferase involved in cell wall biosynthesis